MSDDVKTQLRIPTALRDQLIRATNTSGRSMNAEIIHRLSTSFASQSLEQADALASGIATGLLQGIAAAAPKELAHYLKPVLERISERARAYFEDPKTAEGIYDFQRQQRKEAIEKAGARQTARREQAKNKNK